MVQPRKEIVSWQEVSQLIAQILPQFEAEFNAIIMISPGGIIPTGMLAAAAGINEIYLAQVNFPLESDLEEAKLFTWPKVTQFPTEAPLEGKNVLVVNNAWGSGRTTWTVYKQVQGAGGFPCTCVLHYNPYRNLLKYQPDFYGAITDAYIIYPWDLDQAGPDHVYLENGGRG
jgi:hypoxanthine phosphoribosyltransferase